MNAAYWFVAVMGLSCIGDMISFAVRLRTQEYSRTPGECVTGIILNAIVAMWAVYILGKL